MDLGATKDSKVGASEARIRQLMLALKSLAGKGKVFFVATCNNLDVMPPALKRRFRRGTWMFDLPSKAELKDIWRINLKRYGLDPGSKLPECEGWTGADVRNVCETADALDCSLEEAKKFVVIVADTDPDSIDKLRRKADGKYLSANRPGIYKASYLNPNNVFEDKRATRLIGGEDN
jgi:ATP-dependent 26S proteasome regulatory subunit